MRFIASTKAMPDLQASAEKQTEEGRMLKDYLVMLEGKVALTVPDAVFAKGRFGKGKTYAELSEGEQEKALGKYKDQLYKEYDKFEDSMLEEGPREVLFHESVMAQIDTAYKKLIHRKDLLVYLGHEKNEKWTSAYAAYKKAVSGILERYWKNVEQDLDDQQTAVTEAGGSTDEDSDEAKDYAAIYYAKERFEYTEALLAAGQGFDIPWPTETFLKDLKDVLERYGPAIQFVSDPGLCESRRDVEEVALPRGDKARGSCSYGYEVRSSARKDGVVVRAEACTSSPCRVMYVVSAPSHVRCLRAEACTSSPRRVMYVVSARNVSSFSARRGDQPFREDAIGAHACTHRAIVLSLAQEGYFPLTRMLSMGHALRCPRHPTYKPIVRRECLADFLWWTGRPHSRSSCRQQRPSR